jgi:hypothetical protein
MEKEAMGDRQQKQGDQGNQRHQQAQQGGQDRNPQDRQQTAPNYDRDKGRMGNKPGQSADHGLVGEDTDGDGKVVQPGQKPGQSHGTGQIRK